MASKDYYKILGVSKNATDKEIASAFRKQSLKWHPDRWATKSEKERKEAEEKYKEINYAHQVLSDPEKRKNYDTFGDPDMKGSAGGGFGGFSDIFKQFAGMGGFGNSGFGSGFDQFIEKGQDVKMRIPLTIEEIFNGCTKKVKFERKVRCPNCHGAGGSGQKTCPHCNGSGQIADIQRTPFGIVQNIKTCPHCKGTGFTYDHKCTSCSGTGFKTSYNTVDVNFPPGIPDGAGLQIHGQGSESNNVKGENGSFIAFAQYTFDTNKYTINGIDVIEKITVPYYDLLLGTTYNITLPNGVTKDIILPACIEEGKLIKLFKEGIKYQGQVGDYYIEVHYNIPKKLTNAEIEHIRAIKSMH